MLTPQKKKPKKKTTPKTGITSSYTTAYQQGVEIWQGGDQFAVVNYR
jgi:hypothetical protein